ncbi:MAG: methionine--tRNA ligase [Clostridiales bacterium GWF2_38_85]|nr:MAG: methionine--tRNA ligase [Clostridiales bacterium GWF2_38_85]HBL84668.1 methionine--tRNA ligase [Clostridiales bacterium]
MNLKEFSRPEFPKRALITGGMPYGEKELYFHHIGGYFIHADIFARFLRDRIGAENVLFVSGIDCYGTGVVIGYEKAKADGFNGTLDDFVARNHRLQKGILDHYQVSLDIYAGSALGEAGEIHAALSAEIFKRLYSNGTLKLERTMQFYDKDKGVFLNGRQVKGRCPIQGCKSENAYADECSLGHQYKPDELIEPISILSGKTPEYVPVENWFFDLPTFEKQITKALVEWEKEPACRRVLLSVIREFLKKPSLFIKKEFIEKVKSIEEMPPFTIIEDEQKPSCELVFTNLDNREKAVSVLTKNGVRYRTGKTLVPFRLSGNVNWGVPVPEINGLSGLTFWVWPESLWAPISFTKTFLGDGTNGTKWEEWWKSDEAQVYQFIGEDNIYFYGIAEIGVFTALKEGYKLPHIVPNRHILFGKTKASSSGDVKPPKAATLLDYYTPEQLRLHFMHTSLSERSVGFEPKAILETNKSGDFDTVLNEGNLVTNVFNRLVRSCFYTAQKHNGGVLSECEVSIEVKEQADRTILEYERFMSELMFDKVFDLLNIYLRDASKDWSARAKSENANEIEQLLADSFHVVKTAVVLFHPITPICCEMIREYLCIDERMWDWRYIFEPLTFFTKPSHKFKFLEPRVDFFKKHSSQFD